MCGQQVQCKGLAVGRKPAQQMIESPHEGQSTVRVRSPRDGVSALESNWGLRPDVGTNGAGAPVLSTKSDAAGRLSHGGMRLPKHSATLDHSAECGAKPDGRGIRKPPP